MLRLADINKSYSVGQNRLRVAGYVGLVLGVALLELGATFLPDSEFFVNPGIDLRLALAATALLVLAGTVAGFVPTYRAARVQAVEALEDE